MTKTEIMHFHKKKLQLHLYLQLQVNGNNKTTQTAVTPLVAGAAKVRFIALK